MARKAALKVVQPPAASLEDATGDFLAAQRAQGNSPRTIDFYDGVLGKVFLPWCVERGIADFGQLDQRALDEFNAWLLNRPERPLAKSSAASYLRAVRGFVRWSEEAKLSAGLKVRQVKVPHRVLDTLSRQELATLEAHADAERDKLIVAILGGSGLRLGELLALRAGDLLEQGRGKSFLRIEGRSYGGGAKGDRGRLVPIRPDIAARLRKLATKGRHAGTTTDRIFVTLRRTSRGAYEPIDARGVQQMLQTLARKADLDPKRCHPHALRHAFVTNSLRAGVNPLQVAQMAGHADLTMIQQVYSHLTSVDDYDAMMKVWTE